MAAAAPSAAIAVERSFRQALLLSEPRELDPDEVEAYQSLMGGYYFASAAEEAARSSMTAQDVIVVAPFECRVESQRLLSVQGKGSGEVSHLLYVDFDVRYSYSPHLPPSDDWGTDADDYGSDRAAAFVEHANDHVSSGTVAEDMRARSLPVLRAHDIGAVSSFATVATEGPTGRPSASPSIGPSTAPTEGESAAPPAAESASPGEPATQTACDAVRAGGPCPAIGAECEPDDGAGGVVCACALAVRHGGGGIFLDGGDDGPGGTTEWSCEVEPREDDEEEPEEQQRRPFTSDDSHGLLSIPAATYTTAAFAFVGVFVVVVVGGGGGE